MLMCQASLLVCFVSKLISDATELQSITEQVALQIAALQSDVELKVSHPNDWHEMRHVLDTPVFSFTVDGIEAYGLGLKFICDSFNAPVLVSAIADDGALALNGWLRSGDQLLSLNHKSVVSSNKGLNLIFRLSNQLSLIFRNCGQYSWHRRGPTGCRFQAEPFPVE